MTELPPIPVDSDERTTLVAFLDYFRAVVRRKAEGLDPTQVRVKVAASELDVLGLVRHLAETERWWFRGVFTAELEDGLFSNDDDEDADFHHTPDDTIDEALAAYAAETARANEIVAAAADLSAMSELVTERRGRVSLRWILVHMIEETARHCGHLDLLREAIDGQTDD
jgi:uncharacterized damage-inducible protein DinB